VLDARGFVFQIQHLVHRAGVVGAIGSRLLIQVHLFSKNVPVGQQQLEAVLLLFL
jgi:hypothetical protein